MRGGEIIELELGYINYDPLQCINLVHGFEESGKESIFFPLFDKHKLGK